MHFLLSPYLVHKYEYAICVFSSYASSTGVSPCLFFMRIGAFLLDDDDDGEHFYYDFSSSDELSESS